MFSADFVSGSRDFTQINFRFADFNTDSADACILVMEYHKSLEKKVSYDH